MTEYEIKGELVDLNTYVNRERANRFAGAALKKKETEICRLAALGLDRIKGAISIDILWITPNLRKDPDNVAFAIKFILDGLTKAKVLEGDGRKQILSIHHEFGLDRENPRIIITLSPKPLGCTSVV